jgi:hypothetical protein
MKNIFLSTILILIYSNHSLFGQVFSFKSLQNGQKIEHRILMDDEYIVETQFTSNPNQFLKTIGGFYKKKGNEIIVKLEFNSNFSKDSLKTISISDNSKWKKISGVTSLLQGKWLMSGRVRGKTERRRDTNQPRKTMKILVDGYFQWIAFNINTFSFMGTGGGSYTAENGTYKEKIDYFSRDNKKVGISLSFSYSKKGQDWHHKGFSSKGDPIHEIWAFRNP